MDEKKYLSADVTYTYDPEADTMTPDGGEPMTYRDFLRGMKDDTVYKTRYKHE
jgi:hypothetical protein